MFPGNAGLSTTEFKGLGFALGATECFGGTAVTPKVWLAEGVFLPRGEPDRPEGSTEDDPWKYPKG
jgi:hypothetical protein